MNDMHQRSSDAPNPAETAPAPSARRKLLRGAFAAPVALTLQSGSALAAATASCVARQVKDPVRSAIDTKVGVWVRVPVWVLDPVGDNNTSTWVSGADIVALAKPGTTTFITATQWCCISAQSAARIATSGGEVPVVVGTKVGSKPQSVGTGTAVSSAEASTSQDIAIKVDASGNIIGVVGDTSGGSAVSGSCWSSFRP